MSWSFAAGVGLVALPLFAWQSVPVAPCDAPPSFADVLRPTRMLHVSADATTDGDGSADRPFPTIERAAQVAVPGTAIRLGPGRHRANQSVTALRGTAAAPIWIGGAPGVSPAPLIEGGREALAIRRSAYVVLHDLEVRGQSDNGVNVDDGAADGATGAHHLALLRLRVRDVGGTGNQDCLKLSGLNDVVVYDSHFERCGGESGSAIDQVGVHGSVIARNTFMSLRGNGVQAKGGSTDIDIRQNLFRDAGQRSVNLGGSTGFSFFRPRLSRNGPNAEARQVRVFNNVISVEPGYNAPFAFVGCIDCLVAHNLVSGSPRWVVRVLQESVSRDGFDFEPSSRGRVVNNVFAFDSRALATAVNVGANTAVETFTFSNNHWLATDAAARSEPRLPVPDRGSMVGGATAYVGSFSEVGHQSTLPSDAPEAGRGAPLPEVSGTFTGACRGATRSIGPLDVS